MRKNLVVLFYLLPKCQRKKKKRGETVFIYFQLKKLFEIQQTKTKKKKNCTFAFS